MTEIKDVIKELQKTITFLDWRDETHVTMRIDEVQKILKHTLQMAIETQEGQKFDLVDNLTYTTIAYEVNGQPISAGANVLTFGDTLKITATPQTGYHLDTLLVNGEPFTNGGTMLVLDNLNVVASSVINTYNLTSTTIGNFETISYMVNGEQVEAGTDVLKYGDVLTINLVASTGYEISTFRVNGEDASISNPINVTSNIDIYAETSAQMFDLSIYSSNATVNCYMNGWLVEQGSGVLQYGQDLVINATTFGEQYELTTLQVNGQDFTSGDYITITGNVSIVALASLKTFDLSTSISNGTISVTRDGIEVSTGTGTIAYGDQITITATADGGYEVTSLQVNGTDFVSGSTMTVTGNISIIATTQSAISRTFGDNSPATLASVSQIIASQNMTAQQVYDTYGWSLGDTIDMTLTNNTVVTMQLVGINHDTLSSDHQTKAGLTLQTLNSLNSYYAVYSSADNAGGWETSYFRVTTVPTIMATIPTEWQNVIKAVDKTSSNGGGTNYTGVVTTSDTLFLPSKIEIRGSSATTNTAGGASEGTQYEYWQTATDFNKTINGSSEAWNLRSLPANYTDYVEYMDRYGGGSGNAAVQRGASIAFCI